MDLFLGDPKRLIHPVQIIGGLIYWLKKGIELITRNSPLKLKIGGLILTITVISLTSLSTLMIEKISRPESSEINFLGTVILIVCLSSSLAAGSLRSSVKEVLKAVSETDKDEEEIITISRTKLSHIVGRDVNQLNKKEILRALAETASENSIDGVFAPIFWMLVGTILWNISSHLPGPLTMAWIYKASSTIDSMIGYKEGKLKYLGWSGAHLDDILTWIPCRLVVLSLPLISQPWASYANLIKKTWKEGSFDPSPNSGLSEAIFANCAQVKMGGKNFYNGIEKTKPILAQDCPDASHNSILRILNLSLGM